MVEGVAVTVRVMTPIALRTSGHAAFALHFHVVFVTKYRHKCPTNFWKKLFWSASYAAFTVGAADLKTVVRYIREQESPA